MTDRDQRVRDPVHGLIVFRGSEPLDQLAWRLLDTPEFQRLRRIRQLGVSEFVFPSATHTRFAHCVGVFHTARQLVEIIRREIPKADYIPERAEVAVIAALLHDLGHGPLSHTFEGVQKSRGVKKKHEKWSAEIVRNPAGCIQPLLDARRAGLAEEVAAMLEKEDPDDIYHAVVSSSFDADRLDYLRRDRLMTGTHAGAIDFDWLMEHVRVRPVALVEPDADEPGDTEPPMVPTFCLDRKALPAAEQFLLARYTLHEQVYFHKTTRCVEAMVGRLLKAVAAIAKEPDVSNRVGLPPGNPLLTFFAQDEPTVEHYLSLDDIVLWGAVEAMTRAGDPAIAELAGRLRARRLFKTLGLESVGADEGRQRHRARLIDERFDAERKAGSVIKDESAKASIYTQIGGDDDRMHKKLHVLDGAKAREITELSRVVEALATPKCFTRYYFENESDREVAKNLRRERR